MNNEHTEKNNTNNTNDTSNNTSSNHNTEVSKKVTMYQRPWLQSVTAIIVIFGALVGFLYWQFTKDTIFIETSYLDAPLVNVSPSTPGTLNALYVKEGDHIDASSPVALVGSETLYAKESGIISDAPKALGSYFSPGQKVVTIVANQKMRVVGQIDETNGLNLIAIGQRATFSVDAFPGKNYDGIVDEVSASSADVGVLFSISDKRPVKKFDIYVRFDVVKYPELKTGMSAKITVHTK